MLSVGRVCGPYALDPLGATDDLGHLCKNRAGQPKPTTRLTPEGSRHSGGGIHPDHGLQATDSALLMFQVLPGGLGQKLDEGSR